MTVALSLIAAYIAIIGALTLFDHLTPKRSTARFTALNVHQHQVVAEEVVAQLAAMPSVTRLKYADRKQWLQESLLIFPTGEQVELQLSVYPNEISDAMAEQIMMDCVEIVRQNAMLHGQETEIIYTNLLSVTSQR